MTTSAPAAPTEMTRTGASAELAARIRARPWAGQSVTLIGYGTMGKQYAKALRALGVGRLRVCSWSAGPMAELDGVEGFETTAGGFERLKMRPAEGELGIIATPTALLGAAAAHLARIGIRRLLIEKPVSLWSSEIDRLADELDGHGVEAWCAYNRLAYPSLHEVRSRAAREGGITSCEYHLTEMIRPDWTQRFPAQELARWGVANSSHVISMAYGLIGLPEQWSGHRRGALPWHPSGAVFVGAGVTVRGIPFSYHADWGSTGRWMVEAHTKASSYRLCPLERVFRRTTARGAWDEVPVAAAAPEVKAGLVEEVAAAFDPSIRNLLSAPTLREAAEMTRYTERVFGYADA